jgi:hypothetical protein
MKFIIDPEILAAKFEAASNGDAPAFAAQLAATPRVREIVVAIQWYSFQDGGLAGFAKSIIAHYPDAFATKTMLERAERQTFADYERDAILGEIAHSWSGESCQYKPTKEEAWLKTRLWDRIYCGEGTGFLLTPTIDDTGEKYKASLGRADFQKLCQDFAADFLAEDLYRICTKPDAIIEPLWYCPAILDVLIKVIDRAAAESMSAIADTAISRAIAGGLQYCLEKRAFIRIDGNSRFGKTESLRA